MNSIEAFKEVKFNRKHVTRKNYELTPEYWKDKTFADFVACIGEEYALADDWEVERIKQSSITTIECILANPECFKNRFNNRVTIEWEE